MPGVGTSGQEPGSSAVWGSAASQVGQWLRLAHSCLLGLVGTCVVWSWAEGGQWRGEALQQEVRKAREGLGFRATLGRAGVSVCQ